MSRLDRAIGAILIVIIEIFMIPVILPIMDSGSAWILLIVAVLFPVLVAWKGDALKEINFGR